MEQERDFVVFTDDDGNEFELDVIDYFEHEGQEYAVLADLSEDCDSCEEEECGECAGQDVYIMRIKVSGDTEEFLPADEDKLEALAAIVEERLGGCCCEDEDCDCGCEDEDCDCGCEDEKCDCHEHDCGCGCKD